MGFFIDSILQRHCGKTLGIGLGESKVGWMDKFIGLSVSFFIGPS
jgi:hypothetical protein